MSPADPAKHRKPKSQTKSQREPLSGDAEPHRARVLAARWHIQPFQATPSDRVKMLCKQGSRMSCTAKLAARRALSKDLHRSTRPLRTGDTGDTRAGLGLPKQALGRPCAARRDYPEVTPGNSGFGGADGGRVRLCS